MGRPAETVQQLAVKAFEVLGCRHLSRIDFIVDRRTGPQLLEINTLPGFTDHSLLPKAAAHAGIPLAGSWKCCWRWPGPARIVCFSVIPQAKANRLARFQETTNADLAPRRNHD